MQTTQHSFIHPENLWREVELRAGQTVVHLGSGVGYFLIPAAKMVGNKGKAIGVDIMPDMLSELESSAARANLGNIVQTLRANLEETPATALPDASADWVLVANAMYQSDPERILREAARLVGSHGRVLVLAWDVAASPMGPPANQRLSRSQLAELLANVGLSIEREFRPSEYHLALVATRGNS